MPRAFSRRSCASFDASQVGRLRPAITLRGRVSIVSYHDAAAE